MFYVDEESYDFDNMTGSVNIVESLLVELLLNEISFEGVVTTDGTEEYFCYPNVSTIKCIIHINKPKNEMSIIGEDFINPQNCQSIFPIEYLTSVAEIVDRIKEDEWGECHYSEFLDRGFHRFAKDFDVIAYRLDKSSKPIGWVIGKV